MDGSYLAKLSVRRRLLLKIEYSFESSWSVVLIKHHIDALLISQLNLIPLE
jgi:hypothetical protein